MYIHYNLILNGIFHISNTFSKIISFKHNSNVILFSWISFSGILSCNGKKGSKEYEISDQDQAKLDLKSSLNVMNQTSFIQVL